jgi:hypothetical protein
MPEVQFVVEHAGCSSCAARIEKSLQTIAVVEAIEVDEEADVASVRLVSAAPLAEERVRGALERASAGSGHEYRVQPGSWHPVGA